MSGPNTLKLTVILFLEGLTSLQHVPTASQLADICTKPLMGGHHHYILSKLEVHSPSNLRGVLEFSAIEYSNNNKIKQQSKLVKTN